MQYRLYAPKAIDCVINLPASKSISNRALVINALSGSKEVPENLSDCDDTDVMVTALRDMPYEINIKAAGTAMRFTSALLSVSEGEEHVITGTDRMKHRPIEVLVNALRNLGADIEYVGEEGFPPLKIRGKQLAGGLLEIPGNVSSQYISALLMIGPVLKKGLELHLTGEIISRPYIDLTLWMMREFGADAEWTAIDTITVKPQPYKSRNYPIENDWSAASYWYEMVALSQDEEAEVKLEGLMDGSRQGDSSVRYLFSLLGVKTKFASRKPGHPTTVTLSKSGHRVSKLEYDFSGSPDLTQTFVVTCALLNIPFHFTGLRTLKIKETDRIEALKKEMRKMGYVIHDGTDASNDSTRPDITLQWDGERCEPDASAGIDTYEDHRMAMAFAPAALLHPICINNPQVVSKSYPRFWDDLTQAGFTLSQEEQS